MAKYEVPEHLLERLKCSLCYEYLSYPPVLKYGELGSVCGRCPALEMEKNASPMREESYEHVAKSMLIFPCRYRPQGCNASLAMDAVPNHEQSCAFKPFFCPVLPLGNCPWQGSIEELHLHFDGIHQHLLLEQAYFETDLVNDYSVHYLIPVDMNLFLLRVEYKSFDQMLRCAAYYLGPPQNAQKYVCDIIFNNICGPGVHRVSNTRVDTYLNLMTHENENVIDVTDIRESLQYPTTIYCQVRFTTVQPLQDGAFANKETQQQQQQQQQEEEEEEEEEENKSVAEITMQMGNVADKLLLDMECPVCQEYMVPPIYMCIKGHSVCGNCKPKLHECPSCRCQMTDSRNYTLEKITDNIPYACKNRFAGCIFIANSKSIRSHEDDCKFSPQPCPFFEYLQCQWAGCTNKLMKHLKKDHASNIHQSCFFTLEYSENVVLREDQKVMEVDGEIFKVYYSYAIGNDAFTIAVLYIGPSENARNFMYETYVTDLNKTNLQLMSKKYCGSIKDDKNDTKHCTIWNLSMVLPFMSETHVIKIKCKILKVSQ